MNARQIDLFDALLATAQVVDAGNKAKFEHPCGFAPELFAKCALTIKEAKIELAGKLGRAAFERGAMCVPALDQALGELLKGSGNDCLPLITAWSKAWHAANLAAPMPAPTVSELHRDPAVRYWVKRAVETALDRDPVDALQDAELLVRVLRRRLDEINAETLAELEQAAAGTGLNAEDMREVNELAGGPWCACGAENAEWRGDRHGRRVFTCAACAPVELEVERLGYCPDRLASPGAAGSMKANKRASKEAS